MWEFLKRFLGYSRDIDPVAPYKIEPPPIPPAQAPTAMPVQTTIVPVLKEVIKVKEAVVKPAPVKAPAQPKAPAKPKAPKEPKA